MKSIINRALTMLGPSIDLYHRKKEQLSASIKEGAELTDIVVQWSPVLGNVLSDKVHRENLFSLGKVITKAKLNNTDKISDRTKRKLLDQIATCTIAVIKDKALIHSIAKNKAGINSLFKKLLESSPEALKELGVNTEMNHQHVIKDLTDFSQSALKLMEDNPNESALVIKHVQENIDLKQQDIKVMPLLLEVAPEAIKIASDPLFNETLSKATKAFPNSDLSHNLAYTKLWGWGESYLANMARSYITWNAKVAQPKEYIADVSTLNEISSQSTPSKPIIKKHRI